ncbi:hypothetical protein B0T22DRAFT_246810 [Podospora appendiculata]|uniref:Ubiquitin 3 binding protein But2 C-terminal domain-containing protein n=1 Tax=Podospora appendiculata TaxID=314037 RepID=A0AAE1C8U5_9PEZI|nr:hypothetical protein B0T22DRAFT_246810 [Podospora appendiculata]
MHPAAIFFSFAASALTVSASPTPINANTHLNTKRTCSVQYPALRTSPTQPIPYSIDISSSQSVDVGFTMPDDATGPCSLMLSLPEQISGCAQVNVVALDGPAQGSLVGTTTFAAGSSATINSFACRPQMCYQLQIASGDGSVQFVESQGVGLTMTYDC